MSAPETGGEPTDQLRGLRPGAGSAGELLRQLLGDAARLVQIYDRCRLAHAGTFFEYYAANPLDLGGKSIEHFFRAWAVRNILERGPSERRDRAFEELRAKALAASEDDPEYDVLALVREAGARLGMAPLSRTIIEVEARLDLICRMVAGSTLGLKKEVAEIECLDADMEVLRLYLSLEVRLGERGLLAVVEGDAAPSDG